MTPEFFQILVILAVSVAPVTFISSLIFVRISGLSPRRRILSRESSFGTETAGSCSCRNSYSTYRFHSIYPTTSSISLIVVVSA